MSRRATVAAILDENTLELGEAPNPPENLELIRNGAVLEQGPDYLLGEGDLAVFAEAPSGDPWLGRTIAPRCS